jgi:hypothetical protein
MTRTEMGDVVVLSEISCLHFSGAELVVDEDVSESARRLRLHRGLSNDGVPDSTLKVLFSTTFRL